MPRPRRGPASADVSENSKVIHERVMIVSVRTEDLPRVPPQQRFEIEKISDDFIKVILHYGYMALPRMPAALTNLRKAGLGADPARRGVARARSRDRG